MGNEITITLNEKQGVAYRSTAKEIFYISGVGSGKSLLMGIWLQKQLSVAGAVCLLGSPTYDTLRDSTLPQVQDAWKKMGIKENEHYVINIRPDETWGVETFSKLSSNKIITFNWGSYLICDSMENYNKHRGSEYDAIAIDEFRDIKKNVRESVLLERLRGRAFKK